MATSQMIKITLGISVAASLLGAAANQQREAVLRNGLRADAVGCYALVDSVGRMLSLEGVAPVIRLDSAIDPWDHSQPPPTTARVLQSVPADTRRRDPITRELHPRWSADSLTDTLRLTFTNGFVGARVALNLPSKSDTLTGVAFPFSDLPEPIGKTRHNVVLGIRRKCP